MDTKNAIELHDVTKTFKLDVEKNEGKESFFKRIQIQSIVKTVLDDVSLNIKKGEIVGILGRNGSGKSTLLSIITKIMEPEQGTIEINGKIAAILELGMGFHNDMSGRENIYLKGELYGFSKKQIDERIDKIIDYSDIREYIDNPVRTYSSGMTARLAFAIMVNVDSEILVVDEVLSVGDRAFSIKAREHFKKLATIGKTILFVSHQIEFIEQVCTRAVWLEKGKIIKDGPAKIICADFTKSMNNSLEILNDLAEAGVADSQYQSALYYRDGAEVEHNESLYQHWLHLAAEQGNIRAQVVWGDILYSKGKSEEAIEYYQSDANKGDSEARLKYSTYRECPNELKTIRDIFKQSAIKG